MTSRRARQARIVRILSRGPVASHEALRALLAAEGIEATQATISRDLREIGAVKGGAGYTLTANLLASVGVGPFMSSGPGQVAAYVGAQHATPRNHTNGHAGAHATSHTAPHANPALSPEAALSSVGRSVAMRTFVVSVERGGSMVVLRTGPGHASLVAAEIDRDSPDGILGTVAGDDTIFVACKGEPAAKRVASDFAHAAGVGKAARSAR